MTGRNQLIIPPIKEFKREKEAKMPDAEHYSGHIPFICNYTAALEILMLSYLTLTEICILQLSLQEKDSHLAQAITKYHTATHPAFPENKEDYAKVIPDLIETLRQAEIVFTNEQAMRKVFDIHRFIFPKCALPESLPASLDQPTYLKLVKDNLIPLTTAIAVFCDYNPAGTSRKPSLSWSSPSEHERQIIDRCCFHLCLGDPSVAVPALEVISKHRLMNCNSHVDSRTLFLIDSLIRHGVPLHPHSVGKKNYSLLPMSVCQYYPSPQVQLIIARGGIKCHLDKDTVDSNPLELIFSDPGFQEKGKKELSELVACFDTEELLQPAEREFKRTLADSKNKHRSICTAVSYLKLIIYSERLQHRIKTNEQYREKIVKLAEFYVINEINYWATMLNLKWTVDYIPYFSHAAHLIQNCSFLFRVDSRPLANCGHFGIRAKSRESYPIATISILENLQKAVYSFYSNLNQQLLDFYWEKMSGLRLGEEVAPPANIRNQEAHLFICTKILELPIFSRDHFKHGVNNKYFQQLKREKETLEMQILSQQVAAIMPDFENPPPRMITVRRALNAY